MQIMAIEYAFQFYEAYTNTLKQDLSKDAALNFADRCTC